LKLVVDTNIVMEALIKKSKVRSFLLSPNYHHSNFINSSIHYTLLGYSILYLDLLSKEGAKDILRRLCIGEARFKDLNGGVTNTRTLTRRLRELIAQGLIQKDGNLYRITAEGSDTFLRIVWLEASRHILINFKELEKLRFEWMKVSLSCLSELFLEEFGSELISLVIYGSTVKGSFQFGRSDIDLLYILEDYSENLWEREGRVFKNFQSTWEYRACDHWFKMLGTYGYPEITTASLQKSYAKRFQPVYLDMLTYRAILIDREGFLQELMEKLGEILKSLGTVRIEYPDGIYYWSLKPDVRPGELIEIELGEENKWP